MQLISKRVEAGLDIRPNSQKPQGKQRRGSTSSEPGQDSSSSIRSFSTRSGERLDNKKKFSERLALKFLGDDSKRLFMLKSVCRAASSPTLTSSYFCSPRSTSRGLLSILCSLVLLELRNRRQSQTVIVRPCLQPAAELTGCSISMSTSLGPRDDYLDATHLLFHSHDVVKRKNHDSYECCQRSEEERASQGAPAPLVGRHERRTIGEGGTIYLGF